MNEKKHYIKKILAIAILLFLFWLLCPQFAFRLMGVDESIMGRTSYQNRNWRIVMKTWTRGIKDYIKINK